MDFPYERVIQFLFDSCKRLESIQSAMQHISEDGVFDKEKRLVANCWLINPYFRFDKTPIILKRSLKSNMCKINIKCLLFVRTF